MSQRQVFLCLAMERLLALLDNRRFQIAFGSTMLAAWAGRTMTTQNETRQKIVSYVMPTMAIYADRNQKQRKKDLFKSLRGNVLELGPGSGINFRYFPKHISWQGVEPNAMLHASLKEEAAINGFPASVLDLKAVSAQEHIASIATGSLDAVVCTKVLGNIADYENVMVEIHRVLKPGGRMYFIENVGHGTGVKAAVQSTYGKIRSFFADGADVSHDIIGAVKKSPWVRVYMEQWPSWVDKERRRAGIKVVTDHDDLSDMLPLVAGVVVKEGGKRKQITSEEYRSNIFKSTKGSFSGSSP